MADIHISGLVSGTDYQGLIDKIIAVRARPLQTMESEKVEIDADVAAWTDISSYMSALTEALDTLRNSQTWNKMVAESSDSSAVTATANSIADETSYVVNVAFLAQAQSISSTQAGTLSPGANANTDLVAAGVLVAGDDFVIEGQTITIGATESLSSLRTQINTAAASMSAANRVYATILDNRLVITRENTGDTDIALNDNTGSPLLALGIYDTGMGTYTNELVNSQDAQFTVNGASVTRSSNTNISDVIANVSLNLLDQTLGPVTLNITKDRETPKTAILDFIEKYNDVAAILTDYGAIEVSGSSSDGAELSSLGELYNDTLVKTLATNIRQQATAVKYPYLNPINASFDYNGNTGIMDSLEDIGVWTSGRENQLSVTDETKLDYTLDNYYDKVQQLFQGSGFDNGIASDFYDYADSVSTSITGDIARRVSTLNTKSDDLDTEIDELTAQLKEYEQTLWEQFTAMEDAVSKMQSQVAYITSLGKK